MITGGLIPFQTNSRLLASNLTLNEARIILDYTIIQRETIDSERKFPISIKKKNLRFCHSNHSPFRFVDYEPVYNFVRQRTVFVRAQFPHFL